MQMLGVFVLSVVLGAGIANAQAMPEDKPESNVQKAKTSIELPKLEKKVQEEDGEEESDDGDKRVRVKNKAIDREKSLYDQVVEALSVSEEGSELKDQVDKLLENYEKNKNVNLYEKLSTLIGKKEGVKGEAEEKLLASLNTILEEAEEFAPYQESLMPCKPTPPLKPNVAAPQTIIKNGNLTRKVGTQNRATGQMILLTGTVVDEACVPVMNAVVQIWQNDNNGRTYKYYQRQSSWDKPKSGKDPYFAYSGTAQTDNLGRFRLLTIIPGAKEGHAPEINVRIKQPDFSGLTTRLYFDKHPNNESDEALQSLNVDESRHQPDIRDRVLVRAAPSGEEGWRTYDIKLVLRGIAQYREY